MYKHYLVSISDDPWPIQKNSSCFSYCWQLTIPSKDEPAYRSSCKVRPLLDYINTVCMHYFIPGQAIAIDESLIAGKVWNPIRQYLPNK